MTEAEKTTGAESLFASGGEMGALMRSRDWSKTPLGPIERWSQSLKTAVRIMLTSRQPMFVWWGEELINLYNDAYKAIVGGKHPQALGQPASQVWREIWDQVEPRAKSVTLKNEGTYDEALLLIMERNGYPEETYYTFSYSPVPDDRGNTGGIICANSDDTQRIIGERQLTLLRELAARTADARTFDEACTLSASCLETNLYDLPFAAIYLVDPKQQCFSLAGVCGIDRNHAAVPATVGFDTDSVWSFTEVMKTHQACIVSDLAATFDSLPTGAWQRSPHQAVVVPIAPSGQTGRAGILVVGLNPFRLFDDNYRRFIDLVAAQISASIANANAYEEERKRAEALTQLDRAKTAFFSNVSHEFRTPLTLMLSPLEDTLANINGELPPQQRETLELVHRNGLRLLKLVNTLLDFSRIEAGRIQAVYEPTDLATFTAELASMFRSAIERAGLHLTIDCPPLPEPVYVDRDMWEKIVLNLLSNAFKFTFEGEIAVGLHLAGDRVQLSVRDTGIGIPAAELPRLFERFYRVSGTRSRTYEGSGIGLALVQELVKLHGGTVSVESAIEQGTTFTVTIGLGSAHLPSDRIQASRTLESTALGAAPFVEEALRWLPFEEAEGQSVRRAEERNSLSSPAHLLTCSPASFARILVADDNADMRDYVKRLLSQYYDVEAVGDGIAALLAIAQQMPDLILTDVMMPRLDGFGLLRELRSTPQTQELPIILLSARAGEESRMEGLAAGADDYLIKPFSARELLARVEANLKLARLRQAAAQQERVLRVEAQTAKANLESVLSGINDQFLVLDREWRYTYVNDRVVEITGKQREELLGKSIWELFPETVGTQFYTQLHQAVAEQTPVHFEYFYSPWQRWFENRVYPAENGVTIFSAEITARKLAETALRDAYSTLRDRETYLRLIVESAKEYAIITLDMAGQIASWNSGAQRLLGYDEAEIVGQHGRIIFTPEDIALEMPEKEMHKALTQGRAENERWHVRKDGSRFWGSGLAMPLRDEAEQFQGFLKIMQDKTERRQAEQEREQLLAREQAAREQAETANRIKDEFLAVLSHELRTPLNPILGWSRLLRHSKLDANKTAHALETIERNAKLQTQLIEDLLDVSRILRGKLSLNTVPVNLASIVESAIETVRLAAEAKAIQIQTAFAPNVGHILGDPARLQQVVWNLLSNAVKFTPTGGRIEISLTRVEEAEELRDRGAGEQVSNYQLPTFHAPLTSYAQIQVSDTGKGIPPDFLPHVFEYFRQADGTTTRTFGGLGLGLAIVRHLVELHGGTVQAESQGEGQGATFIVRLPIMKIDNGRIENEDSALQTASSQPLAGIRVLLVDDEADTRDLIAFILEQAGAIVTSVTSAIAALEVLAQTQPDVLVSDIGMPQMDGYMLIRQVRSLPQGKQILAIALTAYAGEIDYRQALAAGFQQHIAKPVEPVQLIEAIASACSNTSKHKQ